jgi:predicted membrane-bound mannosyltransferase
MISLSIAGAVVLVAAALVSVILFSSLFTHKAGISDSITSITGYIIRSDGEGSAGNHSYPWYHYLRIVTWWQVDDGSIWTEMLVVILAVVGLIAGLIGKGCGKVSIPFVRFVGVFTVVMTVVYSTLSYKTPWCLLGFFHGMILLAGIGAAVLLRIAKPAPLKAVVAVVLLAATSHLAWQGWRGSFSQCAEPTNPYVYSHTTWDVPELARMVRDIASKHPDKNAMHVQVICADNDPWPFPWYLRDFPRLDIRVFHKDGRILPWQLAPIIIYRPDLSAAVEDTLTIKMLQTPPYSWYNPAAKEGQDPRSWELRPGAPLSVRIDRAILKQYQAAQDKSK